MIDEIRLAEKSKWFLECLEGEYGKGWNDCNKHWIKVIQEMPKASEWIPCSERLPERCAEVLISTHVGVYIGEKTAGGYDICEEYWVSDKAVLAWMPLPEPYKAGDSDG